MGLSSLSKSQFFDDSIKFWKSSEFDNICLKKISEQNSSTKSISHLSKKGFDLFNLQFSNDYFFTIENSKIYDFDGFCKNNVINDLYNIVKEEEIRNF